MKLCKKTMALALCLTLSLLAFGGCTSRNKDSSSSSSLSSSSMPEVMPTPPSAPEGSLSSSMPEEMPSSSAPSSESSMNDPMSSSSAAEPTAAAGSADYAAIGALDGAQIQWGPGRQFDDENRPTAPIGLQEKYGSQYDCMFIGDKEDKNIYLTFDQGYENGYTAKILDTLKEKQVPALFFLTGHYVNTAPELIQRMIDEGHTLGNHSNRHYDFTQIPLQQADKDLQELRDMLKDQFNYDCDLFRFPEGNFSEQSLALVQQKQCKAVFWSFAYADWDVNKQLPTSEALEQLNARLHNGAVYLLHAVSSTNAAVLGDFIDSARAQGYTFADIEA